MTINIEYVEATGWTEIKSKYFPAICSNAPMPKIKYFDAVIWLELLFIKDKLSYSKYINPEKSIKAKKI